MSPKPFTQEDRHKAIERAVFTLRSEGEAILSLCDRLDGSFAEAVELIIGCKGRLVVTGMGKSGAIGRKLAGTFSSTGTASLFLHPAEGIHGDLGMVTADDVVLALSNSGESEEIVNILPAIARIGANMIAMVGRNESTLATYAKVVLDSSVECEACPLGLAPTTSTAVQLALGDALALSVMEARHFTSEDYALFHPGGSLGRKLLLRVADVMRTGPAVAIVAMDAVLRDVMFAITKAGAGAALVIDNQGRLAGIITDGDIRRALLVDDNALMKLSSEVMGTNPRTIVPDRLATEGLRMMESPPRQIGEMPVIEDGKPVGMLMLKDLVAAGDCVMIDKLSNIKLLAMDVDGTLTDGAMIFLGGEQVKMFSVYDGLGIRLAMNYGLKIAWVTGNVTDSVVQRAKSLGVTDVYQGARLKSTAMKQIASDHGLTMDQIAYIGDDLNDIPAFECAGVSFATANAVDEVKDRADLITAHKGGQGAVREAIETILKSTGKWAEAVDSFLSELAREEAEGKGPEAVA